MGGTCCTAVRIAAQVLPQIMQSVM
jgi:hypothetical protein